MDVPIPPERTAATGALVRAAEAVRLRRAPAVAAIALAALVAAACSDAPEGSGARPILFGPEGNRLNAYDVASLARQTVIPSAADDPVHGRDINGQICFAPDGGRLFIAGEDTGQPVEPAGWGVFELRGSEVGSLSAVQVGKLNLTFQPSRPAGDPYGCGFLSDGRLVTTDIGPDAAGPAGGQLAIWFPPFDGVGGTFCKLDVAIGTAGAIYVDAEDRVYVASTRVEPGIYRYTGPFPTSDDAAGGCGRRDATGAPLADSVNRERFIPADENLPTPAALVASRYDTYYVSSVINGVIAEYDAAGRFLRRILEPPAGEVLGPDSYSTGTPFGLAIADDGTLFYADLGIVLDGSGIGPGRGKGTERQIRFDDPREGLPVAEPPRTIDSGLNFPDGLGIFPR